LWEKSLGDFESDEISKLFINKNGDIFIFGMSASSGFSYLGNHGPFNINTSEGDVWIIKLKTNECNFNPNLIINQDFGSFTKIKSNGNVSINSKVLEENSIFISAGTSITLNSGFETKPNTFSTFNIFGCDNN
jgi:hypothetical protein